MPVDMSVITPRERAHAFGAGAILGLAGMSAYYLPVTKNRFVRNSYDIVKNKAITDIEILNEAALALSENKLKSEHKLFLSQMNVVENVNAINTKIADLRKILSDSDTVKTLKTKFLDSFANFKQSEALVDPISIKALKKIRWTNFSWGAVIGFILGSVISMRMEESKNNSSQV